MESIEKFEAGEKLLCYHGSILYEAKCLELDKTKDEILYLIHYNGWNKNHDEWVNDTRLLKINDENLQLQKKLFKEATKKSDENDRNVAIRKKATDDQRENISKSAKLKEKNDNNKIVNNNKLKLNDQFLKPNDEKPVRTKRKLSTQNGDNCESMHKKSKLDVKSMKIVDLSKGFDQFLTNNKIKLKIPDELKDFLLDDWDQVTRQYKMLETPCKKNVATILNEYTTYRSKYENNQSLLNKTITHLREFFDVMLGPQLLYKFERIQYLEILTEHKNTKMSKLYGYAHFLRLIVKFDEMIAYVPLNEHQLENLIFYINDILVFLQKNNSKYSNIVNYVLASPEYVRRSLF